MTKKICKNCKLIFEARNPNHQVCMRCSIEFFNHTVKRLHEMPVFVHHHREHIKRLCQEPFRMSKEFTKKLF